MSNYQKIHDLVIDIKNRKTEICFHYLSSENMVTTDTKILFIENLRSDTEEPMLLFPKKESVRHTLGAAADGGVFLYQGRKAILEKHIGKYPSFERVVPSRDKAKYIEKGHKLNHLLDLIYYISITEGVAFDFVKNNAIFKEFGKMEIEPNTYYSADGVKNPVMIACENYKLIIMPYVVGLV
jgi:hypothetical protein